MNALKAFLWARRRARRELPSYSEAFEHGQDVAEQWEPNPYPRGTPARRGFRDGRRAEQKRALMLEHLSTIEDSPALEAPWWAYP